MATAHTPPLDRLPQEYGLLGELPRPYQETVSHVVAAYRALGSSGHVVFVAGDRGSGQNRVLRDLVYILRREKNSPTILHGSIHEDGYRPSVSAAEQPGLLQAMKWLASQPVAASDPSAMLVAQILSLTVNVVDIRNTIVQARLKKFERLDDAARFKALLLDAARLRPVVLVVEDFDRSPNGWLTEVVNQIWEEGAARLPVLMVLGVVGPAHVGPHEDGELPLEYVERRLLDDDALGIGQWFYLQPLTGVQIDEWLGPFEETLLQRLFQLAHGNMELTEATVRNWRDERVIDLPELLGAWRVERDLGPAELDGLMASLNRQLSSLLGTTEIHHNDRMRTILQCGALQGPVFTAEAVALALGEDPPAVIKELNDRLVQQHSVPNGLLRDAGVAEIVQHNKGIRLHRRYEFLAEDSRLALIDSLAPRRQARLRGKLADALVKVYAPRVAAIARTVADLYAASQDRKHATYFNRMADFSLSPEALWSRARALLGRPAPHDRWDTIQQADLLYHAARANEGRKPLGQCLEIYDRAHALATSANSGHLIVVTDCMAVGVLLSLDAARAGERLKRTLQAAEAWGDKADLSLALFMDGYFQKRHGDPALALSNLERAFQLAKEGEAPLLASDSLIALVNLELESPPVGDLTRLAQRAEEAASIARGTFSEVAALMTLASVQVLDLEMRADSISTLRKAFELADQWDDLLAKASIAVRLGCAALGDEEFETSIDELQKALGWYQELHDVRGEADSIFWLGQVAKAQGRASESLQLYSLAFELVKAPQTLAAIVQTVAAHRLSQADVKALQQESTAALQGDRGWALIRRIFGDR